MRTSYGADYEDTPQIDNGLDITLTGYILDSRYASPVASLGVLSSTVSVNQQDPVAGPTPTAGSNGAFTITIPIATLQSATNGVGLVDIIVSSTTAHSRSWHIFLRPWLVAEQNAVETDKFIGNLGDTEKAASVQDFYTGLWYSADEMVQVDGRMVHRGMGYKDKQLESELI